MVTKDQVLEALREVMDPELRRSVVELNMVREIKIERDVVYVEIALTIKGCPLKGKIEEDVRSRVAAVPGVEKVIVKLDVMTDEEKQTMMDRLQGKRESKSQIMAPNSKVQIIGVASGKGGVGKSTVTVNLALALKQQGFEVGVLDADIYGFSIPRLLGVSGRPQVVNKAMVPIEAYDMQVMSIGFMVDDHTPIIWRGPMLGGAIDQFLNDVLWGDLDYLLIDLPPGTGDVALSIGQRLPNARMLLVTTPQAGAYHVASRSAYLVQKMNQELIGIVENMSSFVCPHCSEQTNLFGSGGADALARELDVPVLARIPLEPAVREGGDEGQPVLIAEPDSASARAFRQLAREVAERVVPGVPALEQRS